MLPEQRKAERVPASARRNKTYVQCHVRLHYFHCYYMLVRGCLAGICMLQRSGKR
jgi:hypothetical protein